jgi:hypothetical protein
MTSGYSLGQDLKLLINNSKYSDVEILCGDERIILYGCKAILAARSKVFDKLFYNGMKESYEKQISFPTIDFSGMEIILEYIYTGSVEEESLTKDNIIESFNAADYFQLPELQDLIVKILKNILEKNYEINFSPELLSKAVDTIPISEENILLNLLVEAVAIIPLNTIEFGRLSITALEYLLSCTYYEEERFFITPEYEVFRYSALLAANQVSNNAYKALLKRLPTLEQIEQIENLVQLENKFFIYHQKVADKLEPLIKFIDIRRFKGQVLDNIIEPLKIIPTEIILDANHNNTKSIQFTLNDIQEIPTSIYKFNESDYVWDESTCGSKLIIEANGKVVSALDDCNLNQCVKSKMALGDKGIFEWDIIIEKTCAQAWIGVSASENLNYENLALTGWVICSNSYYYNSKSWSSYCPSFENGTRITVRLDMNKSSCTFKVNGKRYPQISEWNNLPSKLYPVVSLRYPGRFRIESTRYKSEKGFWESLKDML